MKRKLLILVALIFVQYVYLFAGPAYPYPVNIIQSDGSKITILLKGDEHFHYSQTTDGFIITQNTKGIYEYADIDTSNKIKPSGVKAKNENERDAKDIQYVQTLKKGKILERLLLNQNSTVSNKLGIQNVNLSNISPTAPLIGTRKLLCILIGYQDKPFTKTQTQFNNLMNQIGYNAGTAVGSVRDFYLENSCGQLNLEITVVGPYTADHNMAYYGANASNGNDKNPRDLIIEAVQKANPIVNYADFDNDNDGYVDGVHVIFAGYGEENPDASIDAIWSHHGNIPDLTLDGKKISSYSCSPELRSAYGNTITGIGVICHELGHVFGAPDFYDTNYATGGQYQGTGVWDIMARGVSDGSRGEDIPPHHNPYTKTQIFKWATAQSLPADNSFVNLEPANSSSNSFYKIDTNTSGEYFLIENRQQLGFDSYLFGHGMMIYHVHSQIESDRLTINTTYPQKLYPVCASATQNPSNSPDSYGQINFPSCPFPGTSNKNAFAANTIPSATSWAGIATGKDLRLITETGNNITFVVNPSISGPSRICSQATYTTINNLPPGATVAWSAIPSGIVSIQQNGNSATLTKVGNGNITLSATINNSFTVTKDIGVGSPYYLGISGISNLTDWGSNTFKVLPGGGYYAYEGTLSLSDDVGLATSYKWTLVSSTPGKSVSWWPTGSSVDVAMKTTDTNLSLKCTASNSCGSYYQYYTFTTGDMQPMIIAPNPSSDQAEISISDDTTTAASSLTSTSTSKGSSTNGSYRVTVIDSNGLTVYSGSKTQSRFNISTSSFRNGVYTVIVSNGSNTYQNKLIVKH